MLLKSMDFTLKHLSKDRLSVFLFHSVPRQSPELPQTFDLPQFETVIDFIRPRFNIIPLDEAVQAMQQGKLKPRTACLTFDDGYASWFDGALPLLEREGMHATFYITTGQFHGLPMWHERVAQALVALPGPALHLPGFGLPSLPLATLAQRQRAFNVLEQFLKYQSLEAREALLQTLEQAAAVLPASVDAMTEAQLKDLARRGFGIGAHTHSHPILALCGDAVAKREIGAVRETLQAVVGDRVHSFAYPNGRPGLDFHAKHVAMVKAAGYRHAVTTDWGAATVRTSVYEIPRFTPWGPTPQRMALQVARNLLTQPKRVESAPVQPPVVLAVENGAGFGGAVVALQTLMASCTPEQAEFHVVANMPVADFSKIASVRSYRIIADRRWNSRRFASAVRQRSPAWARPALLFGAGRLDDLLNRLPYMLGLLCVALRVRPDIIHGNNEPNSNREAMLVARLLRVPFVQHLRGPLAHTRAASWLLAAPAVFVPVSRWLAGDLLLNGVPSPRIRQVYDAVDLPDTPLGDHASVAPMPDLRTRLNLAPDTLLVAMVGMLVPWKGQGLFLDAVRMVPEFQRPVAFLLIGDTPERGDPLYEEGLRQQTQALGLENRVHFLGRVQQLTAFFPQIDVVVSASTDPEPLGLVMVEAMANGCVFVAPAFGAATEVVEDGCTGFLFAPRDATSLAAKLSEAIDLAAHSAQVTDFKACARTRVHEQFSPARCRDETLRVYQTVLG